MRAVFTVPHSFQGSIFGTVFWRTPKAITATAHKLARIVYRLMRFGEAYVKKTEEAYTQEVRERLEKPLKRRAKEMGYTLVKTEPPPAG